MKNNHVNWTHGLNPEQKKAVLHNHGPLLILAGAGSGKTTVLVARTGRLISDRISAANEMCVLTFTNKAARELKHRVAAKVGNLAKGLWTGTFHSFGLQILRRFHKQCGLSPNFGIVDQSDCNSILKDLLRDVTNATKDRFDVDKLLEMINDHRTGSTLTHQGEDEYHEMAEFLLPKFKKKLEVLGVVDFEGLLIRPIDLFQQSPEVLSKVQGMFNQVMVDEFQDTNAMQMKLINLIVRPHQNITVVGDDDQSIYGWRGAEVKNILNFPREFKNCEVIKLERNYRSSSAILAVANAVIAKNTNRHGKVLRSELSSEEVSLPEVFVLENEEDESEFIVREINALSVKGYSPRDFAILYRSNTQGAFIESALRRAQIPYNISGGTSIFDRREIKDIMAYLKQAISPNEVSLRRILNVPPRGIGDASVEKLGEFAQFHKLTFMEACGIWKDAGLCEKTGQSLEDLLGFLDHLAGRVLDFSIGQTPGSKLVEIFEKELEYKQYLLKTSTDGAIAEKRWSVVEILGRIMDSYMKKRAYDLEALKGFVDAMMLRDDLNQDEDENKAQMMTLHASKGLEYPIVILAGLEEDLLPHKNLGSDIDEERRLFYVGITRAKKRLIMSRCLKRKKHGVVKPVAPSRFLLEIPSDYYKLFEHGSRPVSGQEREDLVQNFLKKLAINSGN